MWLRDRYCYECGSGLVVWIYRQPHCFNCGANYPYRSKEDEEEHRGLVKEDGVWKEGSGIQYCGDDKWHNIYEFEDTKLKSK